MLKVCSARLAFGRQPLLEGGFTIKAGEILTITGPSGSGKSTLLQWLIGAPPADLQAQGQIWLNERLCDVLPTERRQIGILFQEPLLFAHLSVGENLLLGIPGGWRQRTRRRALADDALESAGLGGFARRDPATLSGGQKARIGLLRALLAHPQALLLDEPFAHLDPELRHQFRQWVFSELARLQIPVILVSHHQEDIPASGRVIRINNGSLVATG